MKIASFALCSLVVACAQQDADTDEVAAELAVDSSDNNHNEGAVLTNLMEGTEVAGLNAPTREELAMRILGRAKSRFLPAECVSVTRNAASLKIVLNNCTGPRGLRKVTGTIDAEASVGAGGEHILSATSVGMQINDAVMDIQSTAVYSPATKKLQVETNGQGVGPLGNEIVRNGDYSVGFSEQCATIVGDWSTSVGERSRSTSVSIERCRNACPTGTATHTGRLGRTITVTFDGTATAQWASSAGGTGSIPLRCGQ